jgi:hypothetical protein
MQIMSITTLDKQDLNNWYHEAKIEWNTGQKKNQTRECEQKKESGHTSYREMGNRTNGLQDQKG